MGARALYITAHIQKLQNIWSPDQELYGAVKYYPLADLIFIWYDYKSDGVSIIHANSLLLSYCVARTCRQLYSPASVNSSQPSVANYPLACSFQNRCFHIQIFKSKSAFHILYILMQAARRSHFQPFLYQPKTCSATGSRSFSSTAPSLETPFSNSPSSRDLFLDPSTFESHLMSLRRFLPSL